MDRADREAFMKMLRALKPLAALAEADNPLAIASISNEVVANGKAAYDAGVAYVAAADTPTPLYERQILKRLAD